MNDIINKFLLAGDKFMSEMHLRQPAVFNKNKKQPGCNYSGCGPFTKDRKRIQRFMETGYTEYIYRIELQKAFFQHDMAYGDFKDLKKNSTIR